MKHQATYLHQNCEKGQMGYSSEAIHVVNSCLKTELGSGKQQIVLMEIRKLQYMLVLSPLCVSTPEKNPKVYMKEIIKIINSLLMYL